MQRYQLYHETKVKINLAVCPTAQLMLARMMINTERTVGYNKLKQAVAGMKLGVNNEVNLDTKKAGHKKQTTILQTRSTKLNQNVLL